MTTLVVLPMRALLLFGVAAASRTTLDLYVASKCPDAARCELSFLPDVLGVVGELVDLRLGFIACVLSHAVLSGFVTAVAIVIAVEQTDTFLGFKVETPPGKILLKFIGIMQNLDQTNKYSIALSIPAAAIILAANQIQKRLPKHLPKPHGYQDESPCCELPFAPIDTTFGLTPVVPKASIVSRRSQPELKVPMKPSACAAMIRLVSELSATCARSSALMSASGWISRCRLAGGAGSRNSVSSASAAPDGPPLPPPAASLPPPPAPPPAFGCVDGATPC